MTRIAVVTTVWSSAATNIPASRPDRTVRICRWVRAAESVPGRVLVVSVCWATKPSLIRCCDGSARAPDAVDRPVVDRGHADAVVGLGRVHHLAVAYVYGHMVHVAEVEDQV